MAASRVIPNGLVGDWRLSDEDFLKSFHLPGPEDRNDTLAQLNPLPREERVNFDETEHQYHVDGVLVPRSVTGLLHEYVGVDFDAQAAIATMKSGVFWPEKRSAFEVDGVPMSDAEIAARWARNGEVARARGTHLHFQAECFLCGHAIEEPRSPEFTSFLEIFDGAIKERMNVYRVELNLFHCGLRVAGQPDCLCRAPDGSIIIWDRPPIITLLKARKISEQ